MNKPVRVMSEQEFGALVYLDDSGFGTAMR